jgi:2-oxo-3-hexenedioate decarboxylase
VTTAMDMADTLIRAERAHEPIVPFTWAQPFLSTKTAYEAQTIVIEHRLKSGEHLIGAKLGLTSKVKRDALGITEPVYGRLTSGMLLRPGQPLHADQFIHPRAEPEIAFQLGRQLNTPTTIDEVLAATEAIYPALEVVDSRYSERFRLSDSVADNAGAARFMLGPRSSKLSELVSLPVLGCLFQFPGGAHTAAGGAVMGHPAAAVVWLVNTLASQGGHLDAGSIVLTGGLTASVPLTAGDSVLGEFDGLGPVEIRCE